MAPLSVSHVPSNVYESGTFGFMQVLQEGDLPIAEDLRLGTWSSDSA